MTSDTDVKLTGPYAPFPRVASAFSLSQFRDSGLDQLWIFCLLGQRPHCKKLLQPGSIALAFAEASGDLVLGVFVALSPDSKVLDILAWMYGLSHFMHHTHVRSTFKAFDFDKIRPLVFKIDV